MNHAVLTGRKGLLGGCSSPGFARGYFSLSPSGSNSEALGNCGRFLSCTGSGDVAIIRSCTLSPLLRAF